MTTRAPFVQHAHETVQTTRADTTEAPAAPRPNAVPVLVYQVVVIVPVLAVAIFGIVRYPEAFTHGLIGWIVLIAVIDLLPVPMWRDVELLLDFPATIAVAMLYPAPIACAAVFIGSFSMAEIRGTVQPVRAVFNRAQLAASAPRPINAVRSIAPS